MKRLFLLVATAAMFAACSQTEELASLDNNRDAAPETVDFSVYTPVTRAGEPGEMSTNGTAGGTYKASLKSTGFGVFGYYSDNEQYSVYLKPNFMYNQKVVARGDDWKYEPAKYWPNEFGVDAASEDVDYLSFFAYAPYVNFVPSSGAVDVSQVDESTITDAYKEQLGMTGLTGQELKDAYIDFLQKKNIMGAIRNTSTGDPMIKYAVDWNPKTSVDLLWGVANETRYYEVLTTGNIGANPAQRVDITEGLPYTNLLKMKNEDKIKFLMKHALSWLNVQIDADFNGEGTSATHHGTGKNFIDGHTKIWIRSITFDGFAAQGALNLHNETAGNPRWMDLSGANELETGSVTIYDGRKDGSEGVDSNEATSEKPHTLNPQLVQTKQYKNDASHNPYAIGGTLEEGDGHTGVTNELQNLFNSTKAEDQIYVIPTSEKVNVTIVYDVETADENLATYLSDGLTRGTSIQNRITKTDVFAGKLEAGKKYTLKLHLGMTDVKFEAEVLNWADGDERDTNLPFNH